MNAVTQTKTIDPQQAGAHEANILLVDDDAEVQRMLSEQLLLSQYSVTTVADVAGAVSATRREEFDVILLGMGLHDGGELGLLQRLRAESTPSAIVMIASAEESPLVAQALKAGATDYLVKPLQLDRIMTTVALASRAGRLERENRRLQRKLRDLQNGGELVGCTPALRRLQGVLSRVSETDATVLIEGRTGSGKTLVAHLIHANGRRCNGPVIAAFGESLPEEAIENALHTAHKGTLMIEDIERLPSGSQSRLVRYLKEKRVSAPGVEASAPDARILATTSARLPELVARGRFREDLFYRLNVFPIVVPSLQERRDDIALLAMHFLKVSSETNNIPHKGFTASALILLETHPWPGNVAQLQNAVFRAHVLAGAAPIDRQHLLGPSTGLTTETTEVAPVRQSKPEGQEPAAPGEEDVRPFEEEEKRLLGNALKATKGNVRRAAQLLKIGRATLYRKIQIYKLNLT